MNIVYKKLLQYDITARAFETRSTSYEGPVDPNLSEHSPQILHRKMFLRGYLNKLCSDPSKMEFWEYLDKVGMMHVGQGRVHPLHVEYVHIGATLSFIQDVLTEAILSHPRLKMDRKIALVKALGKVIWIQNDLFAKWYVRDGDEFKAEALLPEVEPEGFLHGKRVLHDGSESESEIEDAAATTGTCPFKGLTMNVASRPARPSAGSRTSSSEEESPSLKAKEVVDDAPKKEAAVTETVVPTSPTPGTCPFASSIPRPRGSSTAAA